MGVLDQVLEYKRQKEAQDAMDLQSIPLAVASFQTAKQQASKSLIDQLQGRKLIAETSKLNSEASLLDNFLKGQGAGGNGSFEIPEMTIGGAKVVNMDATKRVQRQELEGKAQGEAIKNLDDYASSANEALMALDKIEKAAEGLGDFKRGVGNQVAAKAGMAAKKFGKDKNVVEFQGMLSQELAPLARKLAEEKGPLTDNDINRITKGLGGDLTIPLEDKRTLINELREKVKASIKNKAQIAQVSDEDFSKKYTDLHKRAFGDRKSTETSNIAEGTIGKAKDGTPVVRKGGKWVPR